MTPMGWGHISPNNILECGLIQRGGLFGAVGFLKDSGSKLGGPGGLDLWHFQQMHESVVFAVLPL